MPKRKDQRARLMAKPGYGDPFNGPGRALSGGIVFPYTPNIVTSYNVEYSAYELVHANYQQTAYNKTRNPDIQVTGVFNVSTQEEGRYLAGVIHFLKVVTKMNFGPGDPLRGTPPPVLEFSAYGSLNFHRVPVVVGSFSLPYEDGVDYIEVEAFEEVGTIQLPSIMTIAITLMPHYNYRLQNLFSLESFASGSLYKGGYV